MTIARHWTADEDEILKGEYEKNPIHAHEIASDILMRTPTSCRSRLRKLGFAQYMTGWRAWSDKEVEVIAARIDEPSTKVARELSVQLGRSFKSVRSKINSMRREARNV